MENLEEGWRDIGGFYEGLYQLSNLGKVYSEYGEGTILKPAPDSNGYPSVVLYRDGERKTKAVHRHYPRVLWRANANYQ